jgi:hypothetical protein
LSIPLESLWPSHRAGQEAISDRAEWRIAHFGDSALGAMHFRDEVTLMLLAVGGTVVYALAILILFGRN